MTDEARRPKVMHVLVTRTGEPRTGDPRTVGTRTCDPRKLEIRTGDKDNVCTSDKDR